MSFFKCFILLFLFSFLLPSTFALSLLDGEVRVTVYFFLPSDYDPETIYIGSLVYPKDSKYHSYLNTQVVVNVSFVNQIGNNFFVFKKYFDDFDRIGVRREYTLTTLLSAQTPYVVKPLGIASRRDLILEYVEGTNLEHIVYEYGLTRFPEVIAFIFYKLAVAIRYIHDLGVNNNHLYPSHIMVSKKLPYIKILSWSSAQNVTSTDPLYAPVFLKFNPKFSGKHHPRNTWPPQSEDVTCYASTFLATAKFDPIPRTLDGVAYNIYGVDCLKQYNPVFHAIDRLRQQRNPGIGIISIYRIIERLYQANPSDTRDQIRDIWTYLIVALRQVRFSDQDYENWCARYCSSSLLSRQCNIL